MRRFLIFLICLLSITYAFSEDWLSITPINIHDGDTFEYLINNKKHKIRLAYIDAPELKQEFGTTSKSALEEIFKKSSNVKRFIKNIDQYDREVCLIKVTINEKEYDLQSLMIIAGNVWFYQIGKKDENFEKYKNEMIVAKNNKIGIWKTEPIEPWVWRKNKNLIINDDGSKLLKNIQKMNPNKKVILKIN